MHNLAEDLQGKVIDMDYRFDGWDIEDVEKMIKQAVDRSCGELIDISLGFFTTDDLLDHISRWYLSSSFYHSSVSYSYMLTCTVDKMKFMEHEFCYRFHLELGKLIGSIIEIEHTHADTHTHTCYLYFHSADK